MILAPEVCPRGAPPSRTPPVADNHRALSNRPAGTIIGGSLGELHETCEASMHVCRIWIGAVLFATAAADAASAQRRSACAESRPPGVGIALGRSSPYLELDSASVEPGPPGSLSVRTGLQLAGRVEVPIAGPVRVRLEAATSRWNVQRRRYDPDDGFRLIEDVSIGRIATHHLVALAGVGLGRAPACAHVSAGGGLYAFAFRGTSVRRPGFALAAGVEIPVGERGAIQLDGTLHLIARDVAPIASFAPLALSLLAGWVYRF